MWMRQIKGMKTLIAFLGKKDYCKYIDDMKEIIEEKKN